MGSPSTVPCTVIYTQGGRLRDCGQPAVRALRRVYASRWDGGYAATQAECAQHAGHFGHEPLDEEQEVEPEEVARG